MYSSGDDDFLLFVIDSHSVFNISLIRRWMLSVECWTFNSSSLPRVPPFCISDLSAEGGEVLSYNPQSCRADRWQRLSSRTGDGDFLLFVIDLPLSIFVHICPYLSMFVHVRPYHLSHPSIIRIPEIASIFVTLHRYFSLLDPKGVITIIAAGAGRRPKPVANRQQNNYNPAGVEQNTLIAR